MLNHFFLQQDIWPKFFACLAGAYLLSSIGIKLFLNYVKNRHNFFQPIRSDGPESHLKNKKNTPTMGGIFIVLATFFGSLLFLNLHNNYIWIMLFVFLSFAAIGLIDDLMKVIYKNPNGFRGSVKLIIQFLIIGFAFLWLGYTDSAHFSNKVFLPIGQGHFITLGALYILFITFVTVGTANAVNLTDGLDGLVSVPAIISLICLASLTFMVASPNIATNFNLPYMKNTKELMFFSAILIGAILGFLQFNLKPAKIFMGDVGSLAIGSALGFMTIIIKQELAFFVIALLFVAEAMSVILQVSSYKLRKKRIFLMAPLHHHFEKLGWKEQKVVMIFWLTSLFFGILGMLIVLV